MANRYSNPGVYDNLRYAPESFRDMSIAPIAMRQRHDASIAAADAMMFEADNIDVRDREREYANSKKDQLRVRADDLIRKINQTGAGSQSTLADFGNMKREYNKEVSLNGGLGQAAQLKKETDLMRANYMEYATSKMGQSAETAQKNFDLEMNKFDENNPVDKLGTSGFSFKKFEPTFAPKSFQASEIVKDFAPLVGGVSKLIETKGIEIAGYNDDGSPQYISTNGSELTADNIEQLGAFKKAIATSLDENSDIMKHLRYVKQIDINDHSQDEKIRKEFLEKTDSYVDVLRRKTEQEKTGESLAGGSRGRAGVKKKGEKEKEKATIVSTPSGQKINEAGRSITDLMNGNFIRDIEAREAAGEEITEEEKQQKQQYIMMTDKANEIKNNPEVMQKVNASLAKNGTLTNEKGNRDGITVDTYEKNIKSLEDRINKINSYYKIDTKGGQISENSARAVAVFNKIKESREKELEKIKDPKERLAFEVKTKQLANWESQEIEKELNGYKNKVGWQKQELDNAYNESIPSQFLEYSRSYVFGASKASNDLKKEFETFATGAGVNLVNYLENSGGKFRILGDTNIKTIDQKNSEDLRSQFSTGKLSVELDMIVDKGTTGDSQIVFRYKSAGDGGSTGYMYVDYNNKIKDTSVVDNILGELKKGLDHNGQAVVQSIMDNKELAGISVDSEKYKLTGASPRQSAAIVEKSKSINSTYLRLDKRYAESDYITRDSRLKNLVLDKEGYYNVYFKGKEGAKGDEGKDQRLGLGLWMKREMAKDVVDGKSSAYTPEEIDGIQDENKAYKEKLSFIRNMGYISQSSMDVSSGTIKIDDFSPNYQEKRSIFDKEMYENQDNFESQYRVARAFYDEFKGSTIGHRNKKRGI